jgi:hypothetical protein
MDLSGLGKGWLAWRLVGCRSLLGQVEQRFTPILQSARRLPLTRGFCATASWLPTPFGFVELTPEREYLLVTETVEGRAPRALIAEGIKGTPAGYSQPLRRNPRYSPTQMSAITTRTTG